MLTAIMAVAPLKAQIRTFTWQNTQRQYMLFEPSDCDGAVPGCDVGRSPHGERGLKCPPLRAHIL